MSPAHGIGLRAAHYGEILQGGVPCGFVEAITENFLDRGGRPHLLLERLRRDGVEVALHGVSLSVGGLAPLDLAYLDRVRALADTVQAAWVSDHLCFGDAGHGHGYDLWPLPLDRATLDWVADRVASAQDRLGRRILLENVSSYATWRHDQVPEWEALRYVAERADCLLLLDLNNVVVNAHNHGFDPRAFLDGVPAERVAQHHLSGHRDLGTHRFDDHAHAVPDEVWDFFRVARARFGAVPTIVEWDGDVPPLPRVLEESAKAEAIDAQLGLAGARGHPPVVTLAERPDGRRPGPAPGPPPATEEALTAWWHAMREELPLGRLSPRLVAHEHLRPRLHSYVSGYFVRQAQALAATFPRTTELLGGRFQQVVRAYVLACPSREPALERAGRALPAFLGALLEGEPALAEVAAMELARTEALLAPLPPPLDPVPPDQMALATLVPDPSVRLVRLTEAGQRAWGQPSAGAAAIWWRPTTGVHHLWVETNEADALALALAGAPLADVCAAFAAAADPVARAEAVLAAWARRGIVRGACLPSTSPETRCSPGSSPAPPRPTTAATASP